MPSSMTRSSYDLDGFRGPDWRTRGLCRHDPDLWTSEQRGHRGDLDHRRAVHICKQHCPVIEECAASIKEQLPRLGVWAGIHWRKPPDLAGPELLQPASMGCDHFCFEYRGELLNG